MPEKFTYTCESCKEPWVDYTPKRKLCPECVDNYSDSSRNQVENFLDNFTEDTKFLSHAEFYKRLSSHDVMLLGAWMWMREHRINGDEDDRGNY